MKRRRSNRAEKKENYKKIKENDDDDVVGPVPIPDEFVVSNTSVNEKDVGINCFLYESTPFTGIIKHKCTDFIVREIDREGNITYLTEFAKFKEAKKELTEEELSELHEKGMIELKSFIPAECVDKVTELYKATDMHNLPPPVTFKNNDKTERTKIHQIIKEYYPKCLISDTYKEGDDTVMRIRRLGTKQKEVNEKFDNRGTREMWPKDRGDYLEFTLHKFNMDTMTAISQLSYALHCKPKIFSYSGTKDKRAVTTQRVTAYRVTEERLAYSNKSCPNLSVGNCKYVKEELRLGQNQGNYFTVIIRNIESPDEEIQKSVELMKSNGFINYYGLQRFGNCEIPSYKIGRYLLKEDFENAGKLILSPVENGNKEANEAKKIFQETGNAEEALKKMPDNYTFYIERSLLKGLIEFPNSYNNAFDKLNTKTKTLYLHSLQSYIWNNLASFRINNFTHNVIVGDLILENNKPIIVDEKYLNDHKDLSFKDVVIPLPGGNVSIPSLYDPIYDKLLKELDLDKYGWISAKQRVYQLSGAYRNLIEMPKKIEYKILYYNNPDDLLYATDVNKLNGKHIDQLTEGKYRALEISFDLTSGSYATMFLRELMKCDTKASGQIEQSVEHNEG